MSDALFTRFGQEFPAGAVLFRENDPGDVMYVIQTGLVRISKRVGDDDKTLATLGPGEFVGEMAILNTKPRTATATVLEGPARCLVIDAQTLETMVKKNTEIALRLIKKLAKRLDAADTLIEILMHRDPKARVLLGLLRHAEAFGITEHEGIRVRVTAGEVASQVGVDPETAEDLFARLRRLRLIADAPDGSVVVFDLERLEDFIEFLEVPHRFGTP
jgi:CRP/FNR family cyclic AMP-dependent transcriptional regulator